MSYRKNVHGGGGGVYFNTVFPPNVHSWTRFHFFNYMSTARVHVSLYTHSPLTSHPYPHPTYLHPHTHPIGAIATPPYESLEVYSYQ